MSEPFLGQISMFGGNFAPRGWAYCDGQLLAISQNTAVFSLLGTTYGGDGRTTFGLPDLRGRVAVNRGNGPGLSDYRLGQRGGVERTTMNTPQMPAHSHTATTTIHVVDDDATTNEPNGAIMAHAAGNTYATVAPDETMEAGAATTANTNTGGGQAQTNIQPYLAVSYIIALQGIFPSRN